MIVLDPLGGVGSNSKSRVHPSLRLRLADSFHTDFDNACSFEQGIQTASGDRHMKLHFSVLAITSMTLIGGLNSTLNAQALDRKDLAPANPSLIDPSLQGQGRLIFASKIQDTGEILDTDESKVSFLFRNTGLGPLTITQVKVTCGCTVPELAKKTYMPGEQGTLDVTFDPKGKRGALARNITIFTDSELTPSEGIVVRSLVKPVIITDPMVLPFDAVDKGQTSTKDIQVFGRTDDFKVTRATIDNTSTFDIEVIDGGEVEKDGELLKMSIIRVTVKPDAKPDNHRGEITVRTNDERKPIFSLATVARVLGDLQINPVRITMGRMIVGDEFEREFHVVSKSGKAFEITSASANTVALDATYTFVPVDPETRTDWLVTMKGTVANAAPRFNTQLHLVTDVDGEAQLTVQMYGQLQRE